MRRNSSFWGLGRGSLMPQSAEARQHADSSPLACREKDHANAWVRLFREVTESKNRPDTHCVTQRCAPSVWGRLATCAAVGYRRRSAASAAVGRAQRAPPIGRSLPSCPTMPDLPLSVGTPFFMKFRGPKAHPNRRPKAIVCPTHRLHQHRERGFRPLHRPV
jgi:hypothetical protein